MKKAENLKEKAAKRLESAESDLCKIYESRPLICMVDEAHKKLYSHIPLKEFYAKNAEVCNALQEANHMDKSFRVIITE
ncbi:YkgJ family cysteine cluster protein [Helicobacter pylori]|nr:YkgJ family cysteine cluster protein [Helicobacter pylori]